MDAVFLTLAEAIDGGALQAGALWALRSIPGFPPIIQTVHILGIAVVMGSVVLLDLRILGLAVPSQKITEMTNRLMPWLWWALASNLISGAFFLFGRPIRYFNNPIFGWKVSFLIPAVLLALFFHMMNNREEGYWESSSKRLWSARAIALLSLFLWIMVAMAGRWIAYAEYIYYPA